MNFDPGLSPGQTLDNETLRRIFKCSTQGGMRPSTTTHSLVIVSSHAKRLYRDRWIDGVLHYTGMGLTGDQKISHQNKTLAECRTNKVGVFLFEVFQEREYTYIGSVTLADDPYQEIQLDTSGRERRVWMFPLRLTSGSEPILEEDFLREIAQQNERRTCKTSYADLEKRAKTAPAKPGKVQTTGSQYTRDIWVAEFAKRRANGTCQLCGQQAPFKDKHDKPFLETHHIVWLSEGGEDTVDNTVVFCQEEFPAFAA